MSTIVNPIGPIFNQPTNRNFLSPLNTHFALGRAPNLVYNVQKINIPSISIGNAGAPTPFNFLPLGGDKVKWGNLVLSFKIDEDMANYQEIFDWLIALGISDSFANSALLGPSIKNVPVNTAGRTDVAMVTIMDSAQNPNIIITYQDIYPLSLASEDFLDVTKEDVDYATASVTFVYRSYYFHNLNAD